MPMQNSRYFPYMVLFGGILAVSSSAIFIRMAQAEGVPSLAVATWRLALAAVVLTPLALGKQRTELAQLNWVDVGLALLSGAFLAIHLATWISSLEFTSVASSVVLVATNPLWVALIVWLGFKERLSRLMVIGLMLAFVGSVFITLSDADIIRFGAEGLYTDWSNLQNPAGKAGLALWGNALALIGAVTAAFYLLVGRRLRRHLSNTSYVWLVYSSAAVVMLGVLAWEGIGLLGYTILAYLWLTLVAVGPQLLGHTAFNWALAHLSATFVAMAILGEPMGSAILAYFVFDEAFAPLQLFGFMCILIGIALGIWGEEQSDADEIVVSSAEIPVD